MTPMWSRRSFVSCMSSRPPMSTPATVTSPAVGLSSPARMCISVDLPESDGPITAVRRPAAISTETPRGGALAGDAARRAAGGVALAVAAHYAGGGDDRRGDRRRAAVLDQLRLH